MLKKYIYDIYQKILYSINKPAINEIKKLNKSINFVNKNLNFLINQTLDIASVKTAPSVKYVQEGQYNVLERIDECFKKINLEYFLIFGTLLGAVRHKGFVPWDDDIDIAILQEDFELLLQQEKVLNQNGLYLSSPFSFYGSYNSKGWHKIYDGDKQFYVSLFVMDLVNAEEIHSYMAHRAKYNDQARNYTRAYKLGRLSFSEMKEKLHSLKKMYYSHPRFVTKDNIDERTYLVKDIFSHFEPTFTKAKYLYPLAKSPFSLDFSVSGDQTREFPVPKQPDNMLIDYYGRDYLWFPMDLYPKHTHNW